MAPRKGDKNNTSNADFKKAEQKLADKAKKEPGEGLPPKGDKDQDGIPNSKDNRPYVPNQPVYKDKDGNVIKPGPITTGPGTPGNASTPPPPTRPPQPTTPLPEGFEYYFDESSGAWAIRAIAINRPPEPPPVPGHKWVWDETTKQYSAVKIETGESKETAGTRASIRAWITANFLPEQVAPLMAFIEGALTSGDPYEKIIADLQETQAFKDAYPELEARRQRGLGNVSLDYIRGYRQEAKRIAKSIYGTSITDQQIANLIGNNISVSEFEHRLNVFKKVDTLGGPVKAFFEQAVGRPLSDKDLYEWFDPELNTAQLDEEYNDARVRGMPVLYGLKPRSETEVTLYKMLGLSADEVIDRFRAVGQNASRFERIAAIHQDVTKGLPESFGDFYKDLPNELLVQAEVWQNPVARARLQELTNQEIARHNVKGAVQPIQGQLSGLLSTEAKQTYG